MGRDACPPACGAPLHVLMIAPNPFFADRGFSVRLYEQVRELTNMGHRVTVCTYHCGRDLPGLDIRRIPPIPWYGADRIGASGHRLYLDALLFLRALTVCLGRRPDILHGHLHEGGLIAEVIGWLLRIPVVFDSQGSLTGELQEKGALRREGRLYRFVRGLERLINRSADLVVTSSERLAEEIRTTEGLDERDVHVTMDGVNTRDFKPAPPRPELRAELGIPASKRVVVYLGLLTTYQGVDLLVDAVPRVIARRGDAHFLVMGYPNAARYREQAGELGVAEHVTFTGAVPYRQANDYLCLGDVAVSPKISRAEGNGKLYNYMACGLPVVVFDIPVNREILGATGIYAAPGEAAALAEGIVRLLNDAPLAERLGREGRWRAESCFSWRRVAETLVECYAAARARFASARRARGRHA